MVNTIRKNVISHTKTWTQESTQYIYSYMYSYDEQEFSLIIDID